MNGQSRRMTLAEVVTGKIVGATVSWLLNMYFLAAVFGLTVSAADATLITVIYMAVATVRSYVTRRLFNFLMKKGIN